MPSGTSLQRFLPRVTLFLFFCAIGTSALAQLEDDAAYTDRVHLHNGDVITGNMKELDRGKLRFKTEYEQQVWGECSRLITNCIICYNAAILSSLLAHRNSTGDIEDAAQLKNRASEKMLRAFANPLQRRLALPRALYPVCDNPYSAVWIPRHAQLQSIEDSGGPGLDGGPQSAL